jgi:sortase B
MNKWIKLASNIICVIILIIAGRTLINFYISYRTSSKVYTDAVDTYQNVNNSDENSSDKNNADKNDADAITDTADKTVTAVSALDAEVPDINIDFEGIQKKNPDVVAWIYSEDTVINYPIVQGDDNDFYLTHMWNKTEEKHGAIFMDSAQQAGFADANIFIYGHHMKDGTMFASLQKYQDQTYYDEHPVMWIFTPDHTYRLVLYSAYTTSGNDSDTYTIHRGTGASYKEYLDRQISKSNFTPQVKPTENDKVLVLSTCSYSYDDARYVVCGILMDIDT